MKRLEAEKAERARINNAVSAAKVHLQFSGSIFFLLL